MVETDSRGLKVLEGSRGKLLVSLWVLVFLAFVPASAPAQIPPAGTVISSQSIATYELDGSQLRVVSNEVTLSVLPIYGPLLTPDGTPAAPAAVERAFSGETVYFAYRLRNTGNTDDTYELEIIPRVPSEFVPSGAVVYMDLDSDGMVDPGEEAVQEAGPMEPAEEIFLVLEATLPPGLSGGERAHLDLTARSLADSSSFDEGNVVRIEARDESRVLLSKESDVSSVMPGEEITFTIRYSNAGERAAGSIVLTDYIDYGGMVLGSEYVAGSAASMPGGRIEFYDIASSQWIEAEPPAERVKGVRTLLPGLDSGAQGSLTYLVRVADDHESGEIQNAAAADYIGGDGLPYSTSSNLVTIDVGPVSALWIGPSGNPDVETGGPEDVVVVPINGTDTSYTFWHEVLNGGNYTDTVEVNLSDSLMVSPDWRVQFVDSSGAPLLHTSEYTALLGALPRGNSAVVGLRLGSSAESFRRFPGRSMCFDVLAQSLVDENSNDVVEDVFLKTDMPILSVEQSIREPAALVGDVLSYIVTVVNMTGETPVDSVLLVENLSPGLGFAGGSAEPEIKGNLLLWRLGTMEPGEKRTLVFRARVKAGQEWGKLVSSAWVYGVTDVGDRASDGPATAAVRIIEGAFTRRGIVLGSVFEDSDGDGIRGADENGVPGVSVFLEDGTHAVTDSSGLYSIPGVEEGRHVLRIAPSSIPDSLAAAPTGYFGMGAAGETLLDLAPSGNRRVDFPLNRTAAEEKAGSDGESLRFDERAGDYTTDAAAEKAEDVAAGFGYSSPSGSLNADGRGMDGPAGGRAMPVGKSYDALTISSTHFGPASAFLEEIPLEQIATLSLWLREHRDWNVFVSGHTDSIPISTSEFPSNFELSVARARTVFQLLRMNGIPERRMRYVGCGSRMSVASNETPEGRARNRRVEIRIEPPKDYVLGDPRLPEILSRPDTTTYSLADDAGICADIVKPEEGRAYSSRDKIEVEILASLGSEVELYVNNVPVGRERVGQKRIDIKNGTLGVIFYSVRISEGRNDLLVVCRGYGGLRKSCIRHVYLAGKPASIVPERKKIEVPADGKSAPELVFLLSDEAGLPVRDGIFVTVEGPDDLLEGIDTNPHRPHVQVATLNGRAVVTLPPSREPRRERVRVSLNGLSNSTMISYVSRLRDWFLLGYGEGGLGYSDLEGTGSANNSLERHRDGFFAEGKVALYGQGEISAGHVLTCAVDTRPRKEDRLFQRIEPDKYYPIYGDAGELKFETVSRSGAYLKLDHRRYSAMFGDFRTELGDAEFTRYNRSFNGFKGVTRFGMGSVKAFITRTDQITYQEEMSADGTSGFYFLKHYPLIENSEKIRIEVRDRYRPEKIIRIDYIQVNRDYDINYMDGSILFKEPVSATDDDFNPVAIVVSYECRSAGERNLIYGLKTTVEVGDSLEAGVTGILEEEGIENASLVGIDLSGVIGAGVEIESEYAHSEKFLLGGGDAFRFRLGGRYDRDIKWSTYFREIDANFFNPSFTGGKTELGSRKFGAELDWRISTGFSVNSKGYRHKLWEKDERRGYIDLIGSYRTGRLDGRFGFAGAEHSDDMQGDQSALLMIASVGSDKGKTRGQVEWNQMVSGEEVQEYPNRIQAKLSRRLWKRVSAVLRHEYRTGSRTGTRHLTQLGFESQVTEDLHLFSRYRLEGAVSGERGQATIGLKNRFRISDDLTATFTAEKLSTVSGMRTDDFLAFSTGALYTPADRKYRIKGDYEIRLEPDRRKHLFGLAGLKKVSDRFSALFKGDLWFDDEKREADRIKGSSTLGFSLRPSVSRSLVLLSLVRTGYERNSPAHPGGVEKELLASLEANLAFGPLWEFEGKMAGRWVENTFKDYTFGASTFLYQLHLIRVIGGRWDIGVKGRLVHQRETETFRYGGGVELGRMLAENLWLGVGYDFGGHEDGDASINSFTRSGFHVMLRMKFNDKLMKYFYGARPAAPGTN